jgi:site-specific DNA-methyltransferase (adenine-specific)
MNTLYFGDNLEILRDKVSSDYVDLVYLDPPFQSGKSYNIIFQPQLNKIKGATAQIKTFKDTWQWGDEAEKEFEGLITGTITKEKPNQKLIELIKTMRGYLGEVPIMAYLCMMAPRLLEMRRVMKDTGSIYLHCDSTASHYLKILMDAVFRPDNFLNEIIWRRYKRPKGSQHASRRFGTSTDTLLFYGKSDRHKFFADRIKIRLDLDGIEKRYTHSDERGPYYSGPLLRSASMGARPNLVYEYKGFMPGPEGWRMTLEKIRALDAKGDIFWTESGIPRRKVRSAGNPVTHVDNLWADIEAIGSQADERLGYPTQKPEALLERIIKASSNEGDLILDPFCGCGTTIAVAQSQKRKWIGIDITYLAIDVIKKRLEKNRVQEGVDFEIDGEPTDVYSAEKLATKDPFQFQIWCVSKLDATPSETKTGDQGIDGTVNFIDPTKKSKAGIGIIQIKGTQNVNPDMVRGLKGTIKSQNADFGILITLKKATQGMVTEAVKEGYVESMKKIPKIQLITVEDLFKKPIPLMLPGQIFPPYKRPEIKKEQKELF